MFVESISKLSKFYGTKMKKNILFATFRPLILIIIYFIFSAKAFSQDIKNHIENSVYNLKQKLILNEEQVNSITNILNDFFKDKVEGEEVDSLKIISDTNNKIESLLDRKQRIKFDVIKSDWWNRLLKKKSPEPVTEEN
jgi:hypothetical protein